MRFKFLEDVCEKIKELADSNPDSLIDNWDIESAYARLILTSCELSESYIRSHGEGRFSFLEDLFPPSAPYPPLAELAVLGREAERHLHVNPRLCVISLGDIGEVIVDMLLYMNDIHVPEKEQIRRIDILCSQVIHDEEIRSILHELRMSRNTAVHERYALESEAKHLMGYSLRLCEAMFKFIMSPGDMVRGRVARVTDDELIVNMGRIEGIVPSDERTENECVEGESVTCRVLSKDDGRITLSLKDTDSGIWSRLCEHYGAYELGQAVNAEVRRVTNTVGVYVTLKNGLEARIPKSELGSRFFRRDDDEQVTMNLHDVKGIIKWLNPNEYPYMILSLKDMNDELEESSDYIGSAYDFIRLCEDGSPERIAEALDDGADVNAKNPNGMTALMTAALNNPDPKVTELLIERGADVNARNNKGNTALMFAAIKNVPEVVKVLLENGADAELTNDSRKKAMHYAVMNQKLRDSEELSILMGEEPVHETPEPEEQKPSREELQKEFLRLCRSGSEEEIARAIESGVNVHITNRTQATGLMFAAQSNTAGAVELLIDAGIELDAQDINGNTALIFAASYGNDDVVDLLIGKGADVNVMNHSGHKALAFARKNYRLIDTEALRALEKLTHN